MCVGKKKKIRARKYNTISTVTNLHTKGRGDKGAFTAGLGLKSQKELHPMEERKRWTLGRDHHVSRCAGSDGWWAAARAREEGRVEATIRKVRIES